MGLPPNAIAASGAFRLARVASACCRCVVHIGLFYRRHAPVRTGSDLEVVSHSSLWSPLVVDVRSSHPPLSRFGARLRFGATRGISATCRAAHHGPPRSTAGMWAQGNLDSKRQANVRPDCGDSGILSGEISTYEAQQQQTEAPKNEAAELMLRLKARPNSGDN
jgi:hypothetical protein